MGKHADGSYSLDTLEDHRDCKIPLYLICHNCDNDPGPHPWVLRQPGRHERLHYKRLIKQLGKNIKFTTIVAEKLIPCLNCRSADQVEYWRGSPEIVR